MEELRIQKDKELQEKDNKLEILKQRMAESLGKNSMFVGDLLKLFL